MANYKVVDAEQLDNDLRSIADTIRAKNGTTEDINFPEGYIAAYESTPTIIENVEANLNFANGDQMESLPEGYAAKSVKIKKPENLTPENIAEGVEIAGIVGTHEGGCDHNIIEHIEIALDFSNGDQTETLPEGYSANSVTIFKPDTLIAENIAKDVEIAGIIGTHEGGGSTEEIIFPLQSVSGFTFSSDWGVYTKNEIPSPFVLESGKTYKVEWDGTTYICTAAPINDTSTGIGNSLLMGGVDTGEPFGIGSSNNGEGVVYFALDTKTEHDIKISKKVSSGSVEGTAKVTFCNYDGTELYSRLVFIGDDCKDPIVQGKLDTPTRASDVQYNYTFSGWSATQGGSASSTVLNNITADKTVYAAYSTELVKYTVRFYDGDTLMQESQVGYGQTATPPDTMKAGYSFKGWTVDDVQTNDFIITKDTDYYGVWEVYSGVEITDSWDDIIAAVNDGTYKDKYNILDYKPLDCGTEGIVNMQIVAFDTDIKSDGSGTAPITWIAIELLQSTVENYSRWYSAKYTSKLREHYIDTVLPSIPANVKNAIVAVDKTYLDYDNGLGVTKTISDTVWAPSHREWGYHIGSYYENSGVEYPNWEKKVKYLNGVASKWALRTGIRTSTTSAIQGTYVKDTYNKTPWQMLGSGVVDVNVGVCLCFCT